MDGAVRGMPLVSSEAPAQGDQNECRRCGKDFVPLFVRSRTCAHCGHSYCHSCSDHQALKRRNGTEAGYDPVHVCAYCVDYLTMTSYGRTQLKQQSITKLKQYLFAYGIAIPVGLAEKNDLVDLVISARGPSGCVSIAAENFYRRNSVPSRQTDRRGRGPFGSGASNMFGNTNPPPTNQQRSPPPQPAQPPPQARPQPQPQPQARPPPPRPNPSPRPPPQQQYAPPPYPPPPPRPSQPRPSNHPPPTSRPPPPPTSPRPPPTPVPVLAELVELPTEDLSKLSIHTLKGILEHNHVNIHLLVEKEDLVMKVRTLVEQERRERQRVDMMHQMEEDEERRREQEMEDIRRAERESREQVQQDRVRREFSAAQDSFNTPFVEVIPPEDSGSGHMQEWEDVAAARDHDHLSPTEEAASHPLPPSRPDSAPPVPPKPTMQAAEPKKSTVEYDLSLMGRCVVCQDDEANIAIVDCGHLALCMGCSELIMKTTRECPLCRTRIVTEQRLLRIYRS